jgi:hypothetical protein
MKIFTSNQVVSPYDDSIEIESYISLAKILMRRKTISEANKYLILSKKNYSIVNCLDILRVNLNTSNKNIFTFDVIDRDIRSSISRTLLVER